jgi:hypothetical protein
MYMFTCMYKMYVFKKLTAQNESRLTAVFFAVAFTAHDAVCLAVSVVTALGEAATEYVYSTLGETRSIGQPHTTTVSTNPSHVSILVVTPVDKHTHYLNNTVVTPVGIHRY